MVKSDLDFAQRRVDEYLTEERANQGKGQKSAVKAVNNFTINYAFFEKHNLKRKYSWNIGFSLGSKQ